MHLNEGQLTLDRYAGRNANSLLVVTPHGGLAAQSAAKNAVKLVEGFAG
jgi:hypothetical protein